MINQNQSLLPTIPQVPIPFVYIIDSPSSEDLIYGRSIGMAMRDALHSIRINNHYTLAINKAIFNYALSDLLYNTVKWYEQHGYTNPIPFIHLCQHGNHNGIGFTNGEFCAWDELKIILQKYSRATGTSPIVCMASCNGIQAINMVDANNSVFNFIVGNGNQVNQSDLTVAYLALYHNIFNKGFMLHDAVEKMRSASGDSNFFYFMGEQIKQQRFLQSLSCNFNPNFPPAPNI